MLNAQPSRVFCSLALCSVVFIRSAILKFRTKSLPVAFIESQGISHKHAMWIAQCLPHFESVMAASLLTRRVRKPSVDMAILTLLGFTVSILRSIHRGDKSPCFCFGESETSPVGFRDILRNTALLFLLISTKEHTAFVERLIRSRTARALKLAIVAIQVLVISPAVILNLVKRKDRPTETGFEPLVPDPHAFRTMVLLSAEGVEVEVSQILTDPQTVLIMSHECGSCLDLRTSLSSRALEGIACIWVEAELSSIRDDLQQFQGHLDPYATILRVVGDRRVPQLVQLDKHGDILGERYFGKSAIMNFLHLK